MFILNEAHTIGKPRLGYGPADELTLMADSDGDVADARRRQALQMPFQQAPLAYRRQDFGACLLQAASDAGRQQDRGG